MYTGPQKRHNYSVVSEAREELSVGQGRRVGKGASGHLLFLDLDTGFIGIFILEKVIKLLTYLCTF